MCAPNDQNGNHKDICEIGAGENPLSRWTKLKRSESITRSLMCQRRSWSSFPRGSMLWSPTCGAGSNGPGEQFDFMLSRTAAEHMPDAR